MLTRISLRRLAALVAATVLAGAAAASLAALRDDRARAPRLTLDTSAALFGAHNAANLLPGQQAEACTTVANAGDGRGRAALYAPAVTGELAPFLTLTVTRGARPASSSSSCAAFTPDSTAYGLDDPGVIFRGKLAEFPNKTASALIDPADWPAGAAHAFRFELALTDDPASEGRSASWDLRLAVEALDAAVPAPDVAKADAPSSSPSTPSSGPTPSATADSSDGASATSCDRVQLAGAASGRRNRTLVKTVRISRRVRAVLVMRVFGATGAPRVVLTTGLRVRGKTLVIPRWANVRYAVNRAAHVRSRRRPFRVRIAARSLRPGTNRMTVTVKPRRGRGRTQRRTFRVKSTVMRVGGQNVCVVGP